MGIIWVVYYKIVWKWIFHPGGNFKVESFTVIFTFPLDWNRMSIINNYEEWVSEMIKVMMRKMNSWMIDEFDIIRRRIVSEYIFLIICAIQVIFW